MPLTGPELGDGTALSIGIDLALIFQTRWKASRLWPGSPTPSIADSADSLDSLADDKQDAARAEAAGAETAEGQRPSTAGGLALCSQQHLARLLDSPLLPTAALAGAAAVCVGAAASAGGLLLRWVAGYAAAELGFQSFQCWRYASFNAQPEGGPDFAAIPAIKARFLQLHGVIDLRDFISGWFHGAPFETILRGNVLDFVAYGFYCSTFEGLGLQHQAATLAFVAEAERLWGVSFPPGTNPGIRPMAHLWEPLRVMPKPLAVPLFSEAAGVLTRFLLRRQGYVRSRVGSFTFWVRLPAAAGTSQRPRPGRDWGAKAAVQQLRGGGRGSGAGANEGAGRSEAAAAGSGGGGARPLVFLHGVGLGLMPYLRFVRMLADAAPHHPVVLAEAPHVALRFCGAAQPVDALAHALAGLLRRGGFSGATFVAHSYGTFVASRMAQLHPELVHSLALLDPVCCMTCAPHLLANFIYAQPRLKPGVKGALDAARFLCSRDLSIAAAFCRGFYWSELMLWPEDMPRDKTLVVLSAHDDLVPVALVSRQLEAAAEAAGGCPCARVLLHPTAGHGGFLVDVPFQERVVAEVQRLLVAVDGEL